MISLLLDPLVRLHRLDENNAGDMSHLLSYFRQLQRDYQTALVLTHHSAKRAYQNDHNTGSSRPLSQQVLALLTSSSLPLTRQNLRATLRVNNQRLGDVLKQLDQAQQIKQTQDGF